MSREANPGDLWYEDPGPSLKCDYCGELEPWDQMIECGGVITVERAYEIRKSSSWVDVACTHCNHVFTKDD